MDGTPQRRPREEDDGADGEETAKIDVAPPDAETAMRDARSFDKRIRLSRIAKSAEYWETVHFGDQRWAPQFQVSQSLKLESGEGAADGGHVAGEQNIFESLAGPVHVRRSRHAAAKAEPPARLPPPTPIPIDKLNYGRAVLVLDHPSLTNEQLRRYIGQEGTVIKVLVPRGCGYHVKFVDGCVLRLQPGSLAWCRRDQEKNLLGRKSSSKSSGSPAFDSSGAGAGAGSAQPATVGAPVAIPADSSLLPKMLPLFSKTPSTVNGKKILRVHVRYEQIDGRTDMLRPYFTPVTEALPEALEASEDAKAARLRWSVKLSEPLAGSDQWHAREAASGAVKKEDTSGGGGGSAGAGAGAGATGSGDGTGHDGRSSV